MNNTLQPVSQAGRTQSLDFLRGFAILGILIMNIQSFSMPGAAYLNPMVYGDMTGANKWVWILSHVFADQKFMTIFSVLYGAGIVLVTQKAEAKTGKSAGLHYRRTFWLLIIGLIHAHLIWYGDILVLYATCAVFVYLMRNLKPWTLVIVGVLLMAVHTLIYGFFGTSLEYWPPESLEMARGSWLPSESAIQSEIAAVTGSLKEQIAKNSETAFFMETLVAGMIFLWRAGGLMLVGMALYKWGVLTAQRSAKFYRNTMLISWLIGFPIVIWGLLRNFEADWAFEYSMYLGSQFNYWGSLFVAVGYICGIMLLSKSGKLEALQARLAAVGQMALTNYIGQSVICVLIFFGIGLGLFGQVERTTQVLVIIGVWVLQILWSQPWLKTYRFGPLEWVWRSLTYWRRQQLKRSP